jgi:hypothetical protein
MDATAGCYKKNGAPQTNGAQVQLEVTMSLLCTAVVQARQPNKENEKRGETAYLPTP